MLVVMTSSVRASANGAELRLDHPAAHEPLPAPSEAIASWPLSGSIHPAVRTMPREAETSIESVARYLRAHTHGDADRIKAMHDWVAVRIAFDADARPSTSKKVATPLAVFAERRAVCQGYAMLFKALALASGDQAVYIAGEARVIGSAEPVEHAWNAAMVDGHWQLLDITWDAGAFLDGKFVARYGADYLFTPPEVFALTHRPYADGWQLMKKPLSRAEFSGALAAALVLRARLSLGEHAALFRGRRARDRDSAAWPAATSARARRRHRLASHSTSAAPSTKGTASSCAAGSPPASIKSRSSIPRTRPAPT